MKAARAIRFSTGSPLAWAEYVPHLASAYAEHVPGAFPEVLSVPLETAILSWKSPLEITTILGTILDMFLLNLAHRG